MGGGADHVDAIHPAGGANGLRGDQHVETGARAEVTHCLTCGQRRQLALERARLLRVHLEGKDLWPAGAGDAQAAPHDAVRAASDLGAEREARVQEFEAQPALEQHGLDLVGRRLP